MGEPLGTALEETAGGESSTAAFRNRVCCRETCSTSNAMRELTTPKNVNKNLTGFGSGSGSRFRVTVPTGSALPAPNLGCSGCGPRRPDTPRGQGPEPEQPRLGTGTTETTQFKTSIKILVKLPWGVCGGGRERKRGEEEGRGSGVEVGRGRHGE